MKKELNQDEIREVLLGLLKTIKKICVENNLRYFMTGGTLLGSIRHKGFIPWDDDIDIDMPRADLMKLVEIFKNRPPDHIKLLSFYNNKNYFNTFPKLVDTRTRKIYSGVEPLDDAGVNVDIMVLDGYPDNMMDRILFERRLRFYQNMRWGAIQKYGDHNEDDSVPSLKRIRDGIYKMIGHSYALRKIEDLVRPYDFDSCDFVGEFVSNRGITAKVPKRIFSESVDLPFEDDKYKAPIGYHEYMTHCFGDYMQLPPPEKRINHHINKVYWREME